MAVLGAPPTRKVTLLALGTVTLFLVLYLSSRQEVVTVPFFPSGGAASLPRLKAGKTVIYEHAVHDEVVGALGASLAAVNVTSIFNCNFRMGFPEILEEVVGYPPERISPDKDPMREWLKNDEVDNVILTTCTDALPRYYDELLQSTANIVCIVHHAGNALNKLKTPLRTFVGRGQITLLTLAPHVNNAVVADVQAWADEGDDRFWEKAKIETFIPGFVYPKEKEFTRARTFPTKAIIQGNIEKGRRDYDKILTSLNRSVAAAPKLWGYELDPEQNAYVAKYDDPFKLHLVGQPNPKSPVHIPEQLKNIVEINERLSYQDYYNHIASADLLIPAFFGRGTLTETASSTMAASIITRTPVLVSERHTKSYTYIQGPAAVHRGVGEGAVHAIARLRREGDPRAQPKELAAEWDDFERNIDHINSGVWSRVLKAKEQRQLWGSW